MFMGETATLPGINTMLLHLRRVSAYRFRKVYVLSGLFAGFNCQLNPAFSWRPFIPLDLAGMPLCDPGGSYCAGAGECRLEP
jgi:hypothetical protein